SVGGALALDAAWLFAAFLVILTLAAVGIAARRFLLERGGGTVECGLRRGPNGSWRLGVASYRPEELVWCGALGVTMPTGVVAQAARSARAGPSSSPWARRRSPACSPGSRPPRQAPTSAWPSDSRR